MFLNLADQNPYYQSDTEDRNFELLDRFTVVLYDKTSKACLEPLKCGCKQGYSGSCKCAKAKSTFSKLMSMFWRML